MKKKVLFVATVVKTHIMQFHIPYLRMFQEMGWETAVAASNDYENPADCRIPYCDAFYDIPFNRTPWKKENIASYKMLKQIIDRENFDIIHCHTPVGALVARLAARDARKKGTKVIYTAHGFHFFTGAPMMNWTMFFPPEWVCAFMTDVLITINQEDFARAKRLMHAGRIEYVPGVGIDLGRFRDTSAQREVKRRELGYGEKDFLILTVAEMTRNKNHITILRALHLLRGTPEYEHMHYLIVGRGEVWEELVDKARTLGISDHVHFLGYRNDAPELYGCCDLFAFMPLREGLSVALMEAMSSSMPIVCSKIRGNTDLVEGDVSGIFSENDPQAVADNILALYRDPERRETLGKAAAERVKQFGSESVQKRMREIYESL